MKILALDTATERCSVALAVGAEIRAVRCVETARGHADLILPMVKEVLAETGLSLKQLDGIAFGRGPGGFTGVRLGVSVAQGLAFGAGLKVVGVSNLAAVALGSEATGDVLVCMDARMGEVYWAHYRVADGAAQLVGREQVSHPNSVDSSGAGWTMLAGTGFRVFPQLRERHSDVTVVPNSLPHAKEIARLSVVDFAGGLSVLPAQALPVYLRDQVAVAKQ